MNIIMRFVFVVMVAFLGSCSDGTQVSQRIFSIIDERNDDKDKKNDVRFLSFEFEEVMTNFKIDPKSDSIRTILTDQFVIIDGLFVNLAGVKTIQVINDTLSVKF